MLLAVQLWQLQLPERGWGGVRACMCEVWWERSEPCALACMVSVYHYSRGVWRCLHTQTRRDGGLAAELAGLLVYGEGVVV